jgi:3-phenylpropionate/cinnamic acid dioxygenase small subunit
VDHSLNLDPGDRAVIVELLARYAEAIDAGDFAAVGELFSDAELLEPGGARLAGGRDQITALYEASTRRFADGTPRTAHVITNVIVDPVSDDVVEMRSRFTVFQATDELPLQPVVVGRYVDRVERAGGVWRFTARTMIPEAWGEVGHHLLFDPRGTAGR